MKIVNRDVKYFKDDKNYIFIPDNIQAKECNKWINCVIDSKVRFQLEGLGFIKVKIKDKVKEYPVLPHFCYEVEY